LDSKGEGGLLVTMIWLGIFSSERVWAEEEEGIPAAPEIKPLITFSSSTQNCSRKKLSLTVEEVEETELVVNDGVLVDEVELKDSTEILIEANSSEFLDIEPK